MIVFKAVRTSLGVPSFETFSFEQVIFILYFRCLCTNIVFLLNKDDLRAGTMSYSVFADSVHLVLAGRSMSAGTDDSLRVEAEEGTLLEGISQATN